MTLASVVPQALALDAEVLVISDGPDPRAAEVAARHGVRLVELPSPRGANAARNAGIEAAAAELLIFVDDDVSAPPQWLAALLRGVQQAPDHEVFGGPIRARLEGGGPRACGREAPPITTLDLGSEDRDAALVWAANMAVRRRAFARVGLFDERIHGRGEEEDWERRHVAAGGRIRYLAAASIDHRRAAQDATVGALARASYKLGRTARCNDVRKGSAPPLRDELRTLAGCIWHAAARRCANGVVMGAHAAGRLREALSDSRRR